MKNIFVYGTLKKGYWNHSILGEGAELIDHRAVNGFKLYESGIPFMIRTGDLNDRVIGEVYAVDERVIPVLDRLEGHPRMYRREEVAAGIEGYVYQGNVSGVKESPKIDDIYIYGRAKG